MHYRKSIDKEEKIMGKIIVMFENKDKELNMSLYDFIDEQYRKVNPIMVCHVTEEEYNNMKKQIKSGCLNERLPRIINYEERGYDKFRYVVAYNSIENNLLISDYNNPKKIGNYTIDMEGIHYNEKGYQVTNHPDTRRFAFFNFKVYTTESYHDIIAHYEPITLMKNNTIQQKTTELIELIGKSCKTCGTECCGGLNDANNCERWSHIIH